MLHCVNRWKEAFAHLHYERQYYDEENASALAAECRTRIGVPGEVSGRIQLG